MRRRSEARPWVMKDLAAVRLAKMIRSAVKFLVQLLMLLGWLLLKQAAWRRCWRS
jgi:hypothetical protein